MLVKSQHEAVLGVLCLTLRRSLADILWRASPLRDPGLNTALADAGIRVVEADLSREAEVADSVQSVLAATWGGTVMVCFAQQGGGFSGGVRISGRCRLRVIDCGRSGQRILLMTAGHMTRWQPSASSALIRPSLCRASSAARVS